MARAPSTRELPPPLELLCLKALWSLSEGNVNDVRRVVSATRPLAYTTVMTLLDRLARKGVVARRKVGRAFVYTARLSQDSARRLAYREFLETYFDASAEHLLAFLRGGPVTSSSAPVPLPSPDGRLDTALL